MRPVQRNGHWGVVESDGAQEWAVERKRLNSGCYLVSFWTREAACQWIARQEAK